MTQSQEYVSHFRIIALNDPVLFKPALLLEG